MLSLADNMTDTFEHQSCFITIRQRMLLIAFERSIMLLSHASMAQDLEAYTKKVPCTLQTPAMVKYHADQLRGHDLFGC